MPLAKALELLDKPIFRAGHLVSGHTLKHLAAAAAGYWILRMVQKRQPMRNPQKALLSDRPALVMAGASGDGVVEL